MLNLSPWITYSQAFWYYAMVWFRTIDLKSHLIAQFTKNRIIHKKRTTFIKQNINQQFPEEFLYKYAIFKVHLTPKFFFLLKKLSMLWWLFIRKNLILSNPQFFMPRWSTENRTEIATILAHDCVLRVKGLVTTVTSLREHDHLYFAPFRILYLFMFGRLDRYWSQIAEICRTDMPLEVAVM